MPTSATYAGPDRAVFRLCASVVLPFVLSALSSGAAWACAPRLADHVSVDRPITVHSDGSFEDASEDDDWNFLVGRPVRDIGGGRVGQIIEQDPDSCEVLQRLLFVDCTTGEAILVHGLRRRDSDGWWSEEYGGPWDWPVAESTRALQAPDGPLALTASTTVSDIAALAAQEDLTIATDVQVLVAEMKPSNRFDPFRGCEIFYPGSAGADR